MDERMVWFSRILIIFIVMYIFANVRKGRLGEMESLIWIVGCLVVSGLTILPSSLDQIAYLLGVHYPPALLFLVALLLLFILIFRHYKLLSDMECKVKDMAETISILNYEIKELQMRKEKLRV